MTTGPSANSPRYSASSEQSIPASPSPISRSEINPSTYEIFFDPAAAPHGLQQHYRDTKHQTRTNDSSMPRDNNDNFAIYRTLERPRSDEKERSRSPKKSEKKNTPDVENKYDNPYGNRERDRSPSPRKAKKERDTGIRQEAPQKGVSGQKPNSGIIKERRHKEEDTMQRHDRETGETKPDVRYHRDEIAEPMRSVFESGKDPRGRDWEPNESRSEVKSGPRGPQETSHNGNPTSKKSPITPGPWKVPSSARIQPPVHGV